jgi:hypothetical protein
VVIFKNCSDRAEILRGAEFSVLRFCGQIPIDAIAQNLLQCAQSIARHTCDRVSRVAVGARANNGHATSRPSARREEHRSDSSGADIEEPVEMPTTRKTARKKTAKRSTKKTGRKTAKRSTKKR